MKSIILFLLLLIPVVAMAGDSTLKWDACPGATGYKLYQSLDGGTTWSAPIDAGNVLMITITNHPENILILWKLGAYNAAGETIAHYQGAWYDGRRKPPEISGGLGRK